jgi:glycosyltransferase involved in cell wall biosynthesis
VEASTFEKPELSLVVPVFNEEASISGFLARVRPILARVGLSYEVIFVDDGSADTTAAVVAGEAERDARIRLVCFSRNFGKEAALTAGLDWSSGAAVIPMDVDLQDPPELIADFVRHWHDGYDIAFGQRVDRASDTGTKRLTAGLFYGIFNAIAASPIEENVGDYRLMSRAAVDATLQLRERNRFMKGLFAWVGFRKIAVPYQRPGRAAGTSKFNYWRLWNFALDGITSFSTAPLKIWTYIGLLVATAAMVYTLAIVIRTLAFGRDVPGYASLMVVILILGAVQLISLGILGEYVGRLYIETKARPIYLVREAVVFDERAKAAATSAAAVRAKAVQAS